MKFDKLVQKTTMQLLREAPYCSENAVFKIDLNDSSANRNKLKTIIDNNYVVKNSFKGHEVYFAYDSEVNRNIYYFVKDNTIEALVGIHVERNNNYCNAIAKRNVPANKTIMLDIFLEYLPTIYDTIITDTTNNPLSKNFWKKLLKISIQKSLNVVVFNTRNDEETPFTIDEFEYFWKPVLNKMRLPCAQTHMTFKIYFK